MLKFSIMNTLKFRVFPSVNYHATSSYHLNKSYLVVARNIPRHSKIKICKSSTVRSNKVSRMWVSMEKSNLKQLPQRVEYKPYEYKGMRAINTKLQEKLHAMHLQKDCMIVFHAQNIIYYEPPMHNREISASYLINQLPSVQTGLSQANFICKLYSVNPLHSKHSSPREFPIYFWNFNTVSSFILHSFPSCSFLVAILIITCSPIKTLLKQIVHELDQRHNIKFNHTHTH